MKNLLFVVLLIFLLSGCGPTTKGKEISSENVFNIYATGDVTISPSLATQSGDLDQETTAPMDIKPDIPVSMSLTPEQKLDSAVQGVVDAALVKKAEEIEIAAADTEIEEIEKPEVPAAEEYETRFHHTTWGSSDGGKSLVLCPGQAMNFERCTAGKVIVFRHDDDEGREMYWNMSIAAEGDIVCTKNGKEYRYLSDKKMVYGSCE